MKSLFKKVIPLLLSLCMLTMVAFTGCKDTDTPPPVTEVENPAENGYTFTVLYPDGSKVNGSAHSGGPGDVCIQLWDGNKEVKNTLINDVAALVGVNGVARFKCTPGEYTVTLANTPKGYHLGEYKTDATHENYTLSLTPNTVVYTVDLKYSDGTPAANTPVTLTDGKDVNHTVNTDANGKAVFPELDSGTYTITASAEGSVAKAHVTSPTDAVDAITRATVNIELIPYTELRLDDSALLTDEQHSAMVKEFGTYIFNADVNSYYYTSEFGEGKIALYAFMPEYTANYSVLVYAEDRNESSGYNIDFYNDSFSNDVESNLSYGNGTGMFNINCTEGVPYFFACSKTDGSAGRFSFVVSEPDFSNEKFVATTQGSYDMTFRASSQLFGFKPAMSGVYEITTVSDYDTSADNLGNSNNVIESFDEGGEGKNFLARLEVKDSYVGNEYLYRIYVKNADGTPAELPANFKIKITRTGNATPDESQTVYKVNSNLTAKCEEVSGKFTYLALDGSMRPVKDADGFWYVTVNGVKKKVYVALSGNLAKRSGYTGDATDTLSFANIEYLGDGSDKSDSENTNKRVNNNLTVYEDFSKRETRLDYSSFIEHYTGYNNGEYIKGNGICNSDGAYALNEELEEFLTRYFAYGINDNREPIYRAQGHNLVSMFTETPGAVYSLGCAWLLPCGYYA